MLFKKSAPKLMDRTVYINTYIHTYITQLRAVNTAWMGYKTLLAPKRCKHNARRWYTGWF